MCDPTSLKRDLAHGDPFVSVVTVSLNAADTIEATMTSVAMQQVGFEIEHICIDGGSRDSTRAIIDRWAVRSPRVRRLYEPDRGIFDAMNKGLKLARGEYVLFLNSDDFLVAHDTLARAMHGLSPGRADNPDLVLGNVAMGTPGRYGVWRRRKVPRLLNRLRGSGLYPPHQGMFAQRRLLESVGGFDAKLKFSADIYQYYELERRFPLTIRRLKVEIAFMQAGGRANASPLVICRGTLEIFRHLYASRGALVAASMVATKSLQSFAEVRIGRPTRGEWLSPSAATE